MNHFLFALLFFVPAGIANMAPPIANKIPILNQWKTPIDLGKKVRGRRLMGKNKTWRGIVFGSFVAGLVGWALYPHLGPLSTDHVTRFLIGAALGFGALLGDAIESFFKRQIGVPSGESWLGFDQLDYVVGAIIFSIPFVRFTIAEYLVVVAVFLSGHLIISYFGYLLHFKDKPI